MTPYEEIAGAPGGDLLLIADHASARVPDGIDLGVPPHVMGEHVAIDLGIDPLTRHIAARLGCPAILGGVSRLVIDLNREEDAPGLIPAESDGRSVPGNVDLEPATRDRRLGWWRDYHDRVSQLIDMIAPKLLISLHSFTPRLMTSDFARPWQIGILYNQDDRAARIALGLLAQRHVVAGDNLPYSGKLLNASMNRHGETRGLLYLGIEVRQDLIADPMGVTHWGDLLIDLIGQTAAAL